MKDRTMPEDFEERSFRFAKQVRGFTRRLPKTEENREDIPQLVRASGSTASNYVEANDALGKKDLLFRLRIARKEAKESRLFLKLVDCGGDNDLETERTRLVQEAQELKLILSAMIINSERGR